MSSTRATTLDLDIDGSTISPVSSVEIEESVHTGTVCHIRFKRPLDPEWMEVGKPMRVTLRPDRAAPATFRLRTRQVSVARDAGAVQVEIEAADPLASCSEEVQFRTYAGRRPLRDVVKDALSRSVPRNPVAGTDSTTVERDWLFQCQESGWDFIRRIAASVGHVVYWRRDSLQCAEIGNPVQGEPLDPGSRLGRVTRTFRAAPSTSQITWVDPGPRLAHALQLDSNGSSQGMSRRVDSVSSPQRRALAMAGGGRFGRTLVLETSIDVTPGARVSDPRDPRTVWVVESVRHTMGVSRDYRNVITLVEPAAWAATTNRPSGRLFGPFQGVVVDNHDPEGQGRIRIRLSEDPEQRVSPWIPMLATAAGKSTGTYWLPEVDSLVLLVASEECPEDLVAIGSVRGRDQKADSRWLSPHNSRKALVVANGLGILFDEEKRTIRLETPEACLEIDAAGELRIDGRKVDVITRERVNVKGGRQVDINATRINLG